MGIIISKKVETGIETYIETDIETDIETEYKINIKQVNKCKTIYIQINNKYPYGFDILN